MNRPIRKVSIALGLLFLALFVNLNFVQVVKSSSYRDHAGNVRPLLNDYSHPRGQIVVQGVEDTAALATEHNLEALFAGGGIDPVLGDDAAAGERRVLRAKRRAKILDDFLGCRPDVVRVSRTATQLLNAHLGPVAAQLRW